MQSNSKLSLSQKIDLRALKSDVPGVQFTMMGKTTIAFVRKGNLVKFATAICGDNEKKNRPKVGQYYAIDRFISGETVKMPFYQFETMLENEESLALWG